MANATSSQLQQLYIAYFARPADPIGLDYWVPQGTTTKEFAASMWQQNEFQHVYGELSERDQVNQLYINLFDREGDDSGLDYWVGKIDSGQMELASIANDLIYAATYGDAEGSGDDLACLGNRTAAAIAYTEEIRRTDLGEELYQPKTIEPWVPGNLENGKSYLKAIGCGDNSTVNITDYIFPNIAQVLHHDNLLFTRSSQDSFDECSCNNQIKSIATENSLCSSSIDSNINCLINPSPYGLTPSNNTVIEPTVYFDDFL
tara:strand:- start:1176 stop:1955 length:780 start_codon:yes stop_codon:yes gene_type:complete